MKNFCALPFDHVMIKPNGDLDICCTHQTPADKKININENDHDDWLVSDYVHQVRQSFISDQRHPNCSLCWQREDQGFDSLRTRSIKEFAILPDHPGREIKNVEINLGNLCNLRCLMCNENNSSAILSENVRLGINKITQTDMTWNDTGYRNLEKLIAERPYVVNIRGGEPFYNKRLLQIVTDIPVTQARDMVLHITTNATVWDSQWEKALAKFRLVRFMFSLDAVGELYEYIRYPASWSLVEANVRSIMSLRNAKCMVHCVGQNLNISHIHALIEWCDQHDLYLEIEQLLFPPYMQMINLPDCQKKLAISHLDYLKNQCLPNHLAKFVESTYDLLQTTSFQFSLWESFKENISMRDKLRGNSFTTWIKED